MMQEKEMGTIRIEQGTVEFAGKCILKDVSYTFSKGKRTAILGPNGAGKSTLLRALAGLQKLQRGTVCLGVTPIGKVSRQTLSQHIAILSQGLSAPTDVTIESLVDYGRSPYRAWYKREDKEKDAKAVAIAIEACGLQTMKNRLISSLSGGERQRAWIAMALAQEPDILLLDEPTTYLDIAHQLEVMEIVTRLHRERELTTIMVLHDIQHAASYSDEIVIVKDKGIYVHGTPREVLTQETIREVYGVEVDTFTNQRGHRYWCLFD